jgi:hypothetical protein
MKVVCSSEMLVSTYSITTWKTNMVVIVSKLSMFIFNVTFYMKIAPEDGLKISVNKYEEMKQ